MEMTEAPVSASQGAMRSLPRKLESLLSGPNQGLRPEEKKKLRFLQADLQGLIDSYLFEPSEVESPASTASFWMKDVRDLSYDIDDFTYELGHVAVSGARIGAAQIQKLPGVKISRFPDKLKRRQWISDEISGFRTRVKEAIQRHKTYLGGCRWRPSSSSGQHSAPSPCGRAAIRLVGMDSPVKQLCGWLANDGQPEHKVASIVGTSGVGKTTLARQVYHKLGGQFECRAFVQASPKQDMKMLLTSILSQVRRHHLPDSFDVHKLLFEIEAHLQYKTYIIVIDNLQAPSTWDIINHALPKGNCCSRILTTTEVDAIAQTCCADTSKYIFKKEPLSEDESREMFLGTVFGHEAGCPQVLKEVSNEIIKRSGGLPLAIIILASLLVGQPASSIEHWNHIKNSLSSDSSTNTSLEGIKQVLNLGYEYLPHYLKACMLYLCMYEEDCIIWKDDLVKQWIAEGFIHAMDGNGGKEVARSYFDELVNRGMIQPMDINCNDEILSFSVHTMVLHFIRYKSVEENFSIALDHSQTTIRLADKVRRLALHFGNVEHATPPMPASMRLSQVRSLAFSGLLKCMPSFVEFRFIQVLILKLWADPDNRSDNFIGSDDLSGNITEPDDLSDNLTEHDDLSWNLSEISELFRLRYFHLDACHMSVELPTQMKRLKDLVACEIDANVTAVPSDIVDLPGLFFLSIPSEARLPTGIGRMTSLCTLGIIDLSNNSTENIMCLGELTNLQDLRLTCSKLQADNLEKNLECLGLIIRKLSNLKCVTLVPVVSSHVKTQDDASSSRMTISWDGFTTVSLSPALLQRLELSRRCFILSSLPEWTKDLTNLGILKMAVSKVSSEDVVILKGLPSLTALSLFVWTAPTRRIIFDNEGFLVLKYFKFVCVAPCLSFLDGAMPKVHNLKLGFNANRMEQYSLVAAGFEHLIGLKKISIKIGGAGADECDRRSAQLVLTDAISKHPNTSIISVQWVNSKFCGEQDVNAGESSSYQQDTVFIGMELVAGAMVSLISKLGKLLTEEYNLRKSVKKDVEFLRRELESMHTVLIKVGEVPREQLDRQVKIWADEVRELSYNMEDVIDKFLVRVDNIQSHDNANGLKRLMKRMIVVFKKGKNHHRIANAITEITEQFHELAARPERNKVDGITPNPTEAIVLDPRLRALYTEVTELVGISGKRDEDIMRLLSMETEDDASNKRLKKVSIVGFGGLGKTTLAKAVYEKIKGDFDCRAFVPIGRNPDIKKVFRDILIELGNSHSDLTILDAKQLMVKLREFLENKRYLVIIDDIWDESLWEIIKFAFSNRNNLGSRLITTTRIVSVSNSCCSSADDSVYQMKPLSLDDSRKLFHKRIFSSETECPNEFEQVSRDILKKCGGVPLAIITIASALAGGQKVKPKHEWYILLQSLGSGLTEDNSLDEMRRILSFSYYDLPYDLRTCLLYLSIYPEGSEIGRDRLIWKWVAEGFVHPGNQGTSLFLLGLNYFNQLINRSMIQPIYDHLGQISTCRIHDMVLDLICNLSHEAKFVNLLDGTRNSMSSQSNVRRLSLQNINEDHPAKSLTNIMSMSRVRSITIFPTAIDIMPALSRFEALRVLDLMGCNLGENSNLQLHLKDVGHLIHLRYLGLSRTKIRELPPKIGNLQFLEVLDLGNNYIDELPPTVCNLRRLIYLNIYPCKVVPTGVLHNLTSIEVLREILVPLNIIAQELGNLARLRELRIHFKDGHYDLYEGFVKSLCNLHRMESLSIDCNYGETSFELMDLLAERWVPPVHLREFVSRMPSKLSALRGWIKKDPSHLSNLSVLFLWPVKEVQQEDVEIIGGLQSLRRLWMKSTQQIQRLLIIRADVFLCMVDFGLYCGSAAQIMFEPGALPRAEYVRFSLGVRVAKEDGNYGFDLGLRGNLLSLRQRVWVNLYCGGARVGEAKEAEAAVRHALDAHPNHPAVEIYMFPHIAEGAQDDDLM
uniref:RGH1 n=1 Tax=Hordeum vulgare subsp. spontaneum TaxID=77009 RepID=A0A3G2KWU8_HORVS|nr:RGH1 [Hordeum vulgare subsp. spontaneum]